MSCSVNLCENLDLKEIIFVFMGLKLPRACMTVKPAAEVACSAKITVPAFCCPKKWLFRVGLSVLP